MEKISDLRPGMALEGVVTNVTNFGAFVAPGHDRMLINLQGALWALPMKGGEASYLHPVIRRYDRAELKAEYHIQDDLENEWWLEEYARPARAWFDAQLSRGAVPAGAAR